MKTRFLAMSVMAVFVWMGSTASGETTWGDSLTDGVRESASTGIFTPGRYAVDTITNTKWALDTGSTSGWLEQYWSSDQRIMGATILADLPVNVTLQLYYDANGEWIPIAGSVITGEKSGTQHVWFPAEMPSTKKILVRLDGNGADKASVWDIKWIVNTTSEPYGKIQPKSYTFNQEEYINIKPSRLWDGTIGNAWYEPLWSFPWEIFQTNGANAPNKIFPPYMGPPSRNGEIIWELDGTYNVELLKAYFLIPWRSIAFEFWDGKAWTQKQTIGGGLDRGWQRIALTKGITTRRIRITFPNGWEQARFIGELEVWGEGNSETNARALAIPAVSGKGNYHFTVSDVTTGNYRLVVSIQGNQSQPLTGQWNGVPFSVNPVTWQGEDTIYYYDIDKRQLRTAEQFLQLQSASVIRSATFRVLNDNGQINVGSHYSDGYVNTPVKTNEVSGKEKVWNLAKQYEFEKLRCYADGVVNLTLKVGDGGRWTQVPIAYNRQTKCWEANLDGKIGRQLSLSSDSVFLANEVQLYGSPLSDSSVPVEIWWPEKDREVTSGATDGNSIIGWMGDSLIQPLIGTKHPRQADKVFWMPLNQMDLQPGEEQDFTVTGILSGITSSQALKIRWQGNGGTLATLDQGIVLESVNADTYAVSGSVANKNMRCFIQDQEVPVVGNKYTTQVHLTEGLQYIDVKIWDKQKKYVIQSFTKPIYRTVGNPVLALDQPYGDLWSQSDSMMVSGHVGNGIGLALTVNGTAVAIKEDAFQTTIALQEGTQSIALSLTDSNGRKTDRVLTIYKDHTSPGISIQAPQENQYLARSKVTFQISGGTDAQLWWQFNNEAWEAGLASIKTKTYTIADGFYTYKVRAEDRSGNISAVQAVDFCVDTTAPRSFAINANVSGWTNNNTPTIQFTTDDATSGVDHYEYTVDAGVWQTITSPYVMPTIADGVHKVSVRAIDRAGNIQVANLEVKVDTSAPPVPVQFRPVPGTDNITMKWLGVDDGEFYQSYQIERNPAWSDGIRSIKSSSYGDQGYTDSGLKLQDSYSYRVWAVDRAGNVSAKTDWLSAEVGLESISVNQSGTTKVEYENTIVNIPAGAAADDILRFQINELPVEQLTEQLPNPTVSPILQFTVVRKTAGGEEVSPHAVFNTPVTFIYTYSPDKIPDGYTEADLKPYYYDDVWGRWMPITGGLVDPTAHCIRFQTNHFTDYSIQATKADDETAQQLRDCEYNPFKTTIGPGGVNVSTGSGALSTSFTELVLPGKNGLDLTLRRQYDTSTAQSDEKEANTPASSGSYFDVSQNDDGDKPWILGSGWRLSMPHMKWNSSGIWVTDLDGNTISLNQMKLVNTSRSGNDITFRMENHESSDETVLVNIERKKHTWGVWIFKETWYTYKMESVQLVMKDGRSISYDSHGYVVLIQDKARANSITFTYDSDNHKIQNIQDSLGRVVTFTYSTGTKDHKGKVRSYNLLAKITVSCGGASYPEIVYTQDGLNLTTAKDVQGRTWQYGYTSENVMDGTKCFSNGSKDETEKTSSINLLTSVSGPGIGVSTITYHVSTLQYSDTLSGMASSETNQKNTSVGFVLSDQTSGGSSAGFVSVTKTDDPYYEFENSHIRPTKISVALLGNATAQRESTYEFSMYYGGHKQYYVGEAKVDDGRIITTTVYDRTEKKRSSVSQAPEAIRKSIDAEVGLREDTTEVQNYIQTIRTVDENQVLLTLETQKYNVDAMRLASKNIVKAGSDTNVYNVSYEYDDWGNITKEIDTGLVGTRASKKEIDSVYYDQANAVSLIPSGTVPSPSILSDPGVTNYERDLVASRITKIYGWKIESSTESQADVVTESESYAYTSLGQVSTKIKLLDSNRWAVTKYEYGIYGQVCKITDPGLTGSDAGQISTYAYDYTLGDIYRITTTQPNVDLGGASSTSLVQVRDYRTLTGTLSRLQDAGGHITQYGYDWLGRVTNIVKPTNAKVSVAYDDTNLASTVTNELNGVTVYQFDQLGRLLAVTKTNTITSSLASTLGNTSSSEVITTALSYDGYDQVTQVVGPYSSNEVDTNRTKANLVTTFTYDSQGRVITLKEPGAVGIKKNDYDNASNTVTSYDELQNMTRQITDWDGNVIEADKNIDGVWVGTTIYYDGLNRVIAKIDPNKNETTIQYNAAGYESVITSPVRSVWEKNASATVSPVTKKEYYDTGVLKSVTQDSVIGGRLTTNTKVNGLGWILASESPVDTTAITTFYVYDEVGNKKSETSGYKGGIQKGKTWSYDAQGRVLSETDEAGKVTNYEYNAAGNRTKVTDPRNSNAQYTHSFVLTMKYDQFNRLIEADLPQEKTSQTLNSVLLAYDGHGNLVARQETDGVTTRYSYTLRNLLQTEAVSDQTKNTTYTTSHDYDDAGREIGITYPTKRQVQRAYNTAGWLTAEGSDSAGWESYTYDAIGNILQKADQRNNTTTYTYDVDNKTLSVTDAMSHTSRMSYDRLGELTRSTDANKNQHDYAYDRIGRLQSETTPTGASVSYTYDGWGNVITYTDARGTVFTRTYTDTNKLKTEQTVNGSKQESASYDYDEAGDLKTINNGIETDFNLVGSTYQADPYGLIHNETCAAGGTSLSMGYTYDNRQRLKSVTMPDAQSVTYQYNGMGELSGMSDWITGSMSYKNGLLTGYTSGNGLKKQITYDSQDRLATLGYQNGSGDILRNYSFGYDKASNLVTKNDNSYTYDQINQLTTANEHGWFQKKPDEINLDIGETPRDYDGSAAVNYQYEAIDAADTLVSFDWASKGIACRFDTVYGVNELELHPMNATNRIRQKDLAVYYSVDSTAAGQQPQWIRLNGWSLKKTDDGTLLLYFPKIIEARYIKVTNIWDDRDITNTSIDKFATFKNHVHDLLKVWALTKNHSEGYSYDAMGNRIELNTDGKDYGYMYYPNKNGGNLPWVKYDGRWYYQYDAAGNRITKAKAAIDGGSTIQIDTSKEYWTYTWDLHNRLVKVVQKNGVSVSYVYDGQNHRVERTGKNGTTVYAYGRHGALTYQKNLTTKSERTYAYLNDTIIGWTDRCDGVATKYYALTDNLGSVTGVTDKDGKVCWSSEYLPFGTMAGADGSIRFDGMYTGKDVDEETGLTYHWNRWQSEDGATFISEDPARDGLNWYGYCGNNPMNSTDPSGLYGEYTMTGRTQYYMRSDPVQQTTLDRRYGFSPTTNSCKTTSIINSYLADNVTSITEKQIDHVIQNTDGSQRSSVAADGSPNDANAISRNTARALGRDTYLKLSDASSSNNDAPSIEKMVNSAGYTHYVYKDKDGKIDSLDPSRAAAKTYKDFSEQLLKETILPEKKEEEDAAAKAAADADKQAQQQARAAWIAAETAARETEKTSTTTSETNSTGNGSTNTQGKSSVICHELFRQGLMTEGIHSADESFGDWMESHLPIVLHGYQSWATIVVCEMQKSRSFTHVVNFFAKPWTKEMAYWMGVTPHGDFFGFIIMLIGLPLCGIIGLFESSIIIRLFCLCVLVFCFIRYRVIYSHRKGKKYEM